VMILQRNTSTLIGYHNIEFNNNKPPIRGFLFITG
jgi:hypothetical protein